MKTTSNFKEWAYEKAIECNDFRRVHDYICCHFFERNTVLVNLKNGKTWVAVCHESDNFDSNIGIGVAFARFLGEEIPIERKEVNLSSLHYGDKFSFDDDNKYTYIFVAQEPVLNRYIFINEQTQSILSSLCDIRVYTV